MPSLFLLLYPIAGIALLALAGALVLYRSVPISQLRTRFEYTPPECDYLTGTGLASIECPLSALPGFVIILLHIQEDNRFFRHRGFNWPEIRRRVGRFLRAEDRLRGGSSITQQLAKNVLRPGSLGSGPAGLLRKAREAIFTVRLESNFTKEELLSLYLNTVRWGSGRIHGIQSAARFYFQKDAAALDLYEALFLVSILPDAPRIDAGFEAGTDSAFPYQDSFAGFRYFLYWSILRWGWGAVLDPGRLAANEVIDALKVDRQPQFPIAADFAAAIEICALEGVKRLAELCERIIASRRGPKDAD